MTNEAARHTALPQADAPVFWDPKRVGPFVWGSIYNLKVVRWSDGNTLRPLAPAPVS